MNTNTGDQEWRLKAACRDLPLALFFPAKGQQTESAKAKAVCRRCLVRTECLDMALSDMSNRGIWGGTSFVDRIKIRRDGKVVAIVSETDTK